MQQRWPRSPKPGNARSRSQLATRHASAYARAVRSRPSRAETTQIERLSRTSTAMIVPNSLIPKSLVGVDSAIAFGRVGGEQPQAPSVSAYVTEAYDSVLIALDPRSNSGLLGFRPRFGR